MVNMKTQTTAWQYLIGVVFNDKKDVPIELISEFRKLAKLHNLEDYCDYLRDKPLPEKLKEDPWEWKYLEELEKVLPKGVRVLVLKGAAVRDMNLYPLPSLRKSCDLDIFFHGVESFNERKKIIEDLVRKKKIELKGNWQRSLKKIKNVTVAYEDRAIDIHFDLTSPMNNLNYFGLFAKKQNKDLEKQIMERAKPYRNLENVKKMANEDFCLYNIFHYIKEYPYSNFFLIIELFLMLKNNLTILENVEKTAKESNQLYLYKIGFYILNQLYTLNEKEIKVNLTEQKVFKATRIQDANKYSIKSLLTGYFSNAYLVTNGNSLLSLIYSNFYLIINNLILSTFVENPFSVRSVSNFITKILYSFAKLKNRLKSLCFKAASIGNYKSTDTNYTIPTEKKLISVVLQDLQLTFNVPTEFYNDLQRIWKGFLTRNHLNKKIEVEKINNEQSIYPNIEIVYSNGFFYLKSLDNIYGKASLNSTGELLVSNFWDVRTFALCLFRAMTFERNDLLLVHAGAVKIKDETLIFPGESSTGKTTIFNLLTKNGIIGINDDTILLKKENNTWFAYPTPFMSKFQEPITCEKQKLTEIIELIKICGGHEIKPVEADHALAILLNNSLGDIIIDDAGFIQSIMAKKVIDLSEQVKFSAQIKYSLKDSEKLFELINKWLDKPKDSYRLGSDFIRLLELRGISMEPTFRHGDILKVEEVFPDKLRPKDIVGFKTSTNNFPTIHRIKYLLKHKNQTTIITKGDNCIYEDSPNIFKSNQKLLKITGKYRN